MSSMALRLLATLVVATSSVGAFTAPGALLGVNRAKTGAFLPAENAMVGQKHHVSAAQDPGGCIASYAQTGLGLWGAECVASRGLRLRLCCALSAGQRGSGGNMEGSLGSEKGVGLQGGGMKQSKAAMRRPGGGGKQWSPAAELSAKQAMARPGNSKNGHATTMSRHESGRFPMLSGFTTLESLLNATMPLLHDKLDRVRGADLYFPTSISPTWQMGTHPHSSNAHLSAWPASICRRDRSDRQAVCRCASPT